MNRKYIYYIRRSIFDKLCVISLVLLFLNTSVINQYFDITFASTIDLCEEEEEESKEEEQELKVIKFYTFYQTFLLPIDTKNTSQNVKVILDCCIEVFTPPPEFV